MCISLEIDNNTARLCNPPEYQACKAEFDRLHERRRDRRFGEKLYFAGMQKLARRFP